MMPELSLHVLDIAENSVSADAALVKISVTADTAGTVSGAPPDDGLSGQHPDKEK